MKKVNCVYCKQGHAYNPKEHNVCPYCFGDDANKELDLTQAAIKDTEDDIVLTEKARTEAGLKDVTWGQNVEWSWDDEDEHTVSVFVNKKGIDPVVGWLVALTGEEKGKDYRIHMENNYIGRDSKMDICIPVDRAVSKENHASVAFDARTKKFYLTPCNARNIIHVNEEAVFSTTELKPYDIIELGVTKFVFVPFCEGDIDWEQVFEEGK